MAMPANIVCEGDAVILLPSFREGRRNTVPLPPFALIGGGRGPGMLVGLGWGRGFPAGALALMTGKSVVDSPLGGEIGNVGNGRCLVQGVGMVRFCELDRKQMVYHANAMT